MFHNQLSSNNQLSMAMYLPIHFLEMAHMS
jgi:hypothetical protein